jgi:hypothetical protein
MKPFEYQTILVLKSSLYIFFLFFLDNREISFPESGELFFLYGGWAKPLKLPQNI